jgi:hypothetical protein
VLTHTDARPRQCSAATAVTQPERPADFRGGSDWQQERGLSGVSSLPRSWVPHSAQWQQTLAASWSRNRGVFHAPPAGCSA